MDADDAGGDPVCWLHELCPVCGALPSPEAPDRCWRCGAPTAADEDDPPRPSPGKDR